MWATVWLQYTWAEEGGGAAVPLSRGELGRRLTQCDLAEAYLRTNWHLGPSSHLATKDMGRKLGAVPLWREVCWVPI